MNLVAKAVDKIANPPRVSDPDRLRVAVSGKTVLVTGASYGLGEATARKLGAAGAIVLLVARSADKLAALAASINAGGGHAAAYPADLSDETAVPALAERLTENHGPMDVVVSNAGKSIRRSLHLQYDRPQDFERTIGVNYLGPVRLLLGLLPAMRRRGSGHIVSVSTVGVLTAPGPRWGAYLASKSAFDVWLRSVAPELSADGVHVSSVYMTLVHTPMSDPTPILRRMPGLSAEQAADIVAKAIIDRPGRVQPLWVWPIEISSMLLPKALDIGMGLMYRFTTDSPSARGNQP
ncbi:SDR family NAD(P)-dependent oxidoreductase [Mycobacterium sp.]|uniref:SDR family NAD(P)-dependent oxidoreductase n=1 Tax=Mycobacterium sp. TaxID=1785 RepID=UPI003C725942